MPHSPGRNSGFRDALRRVALVAWVLGGAVSSFAQDGDFWKAAWGDSIEDLSSIEAGKLVSAGPERYAVSTRLYGSAFVRFYELVGGELAMGAYSHAELDYRDDHYAEIIVALKRDLTEKYGKPKKKHRGWTRAFVHDPELGVSVMPEITLGRTELVWVWPKLDRTLIELSVRRGATAGGQKIDVLVRYLDKSRLSRLEQKWSDERMQKVEAAKDQL